jgi:hypothetical protein
MTPKRRTTPAAPKTHFWFETREDMSENQPSSAVGIIVPLAVAFVDGLVASSVGRPSSKAGLSASPSASPWFPGRWSVGFGCALVVVPLGRSDTIGPLGLGTEGSAFSNRESLYSPAIDASIVEPKRESCQPRKWPVRPSAPMSETRTVQVPRGSSSLQQVQYS